MAATHKNDRFVTIKRTMHNAPITDENNKEIEDWLSSAVSGINVRHESRTKPVPYTGLTLDQERILLPEVIDIERNTQNEYYEFNKKKKEFYFRLIAFIPAEGLILNIGLEEKNDSSNSPAPSSVSKTNIPIQIDHYIKWRALFENDPRVAKSKEQAMTSLLYQYYILDEVKVVEKEEKIQEERESAMRHYLTINTDIKELRKMITIMEAGTQVLTKEDTDLVKLKSRLMKLLDKEPAFYTSVANDPDIDTRLLLQRFENYRVVEQRTGGAYYDEATTRKISEDKREMIKWLKDVENTAAVTSMKRLLQERAQKQA